MNFETSDGFKLNYHVYGSGQPLVFIHGYSSSQEIWTMQIDFFKHHNFQVITYDQRNHGVSQLDFNLNNIATLVRDLKELISYLNLDHPILIGHSMGASVIYGLLDMNYDNIKAVVAVDESPKMINDSEWSYGFIGMTRANYKFTMDHLKERRQTLNGMASKCKNAIVNVQNQFPFDWQQNKQLLYDHARKDWRSALVGTTIPTLLITAAQSPFFDGKFAYVASQKNPYICHVVIDQSGHCVMSEQVTKFNLIVLNFINSLNKNFGRI